MTKKSVFQDAIDELCKDPVVKKAYDDQVRKIKEQQAQRRKNNGLKK